LTFLGQLHGGVVVAVEEPGEGGLEGVELAGPGRGLALDIGRARGPASDRLHIEATSPVRWEVGGVEASSRLSRTDSVGREVIAKQMLPQAEE
jgi:hypothetical protein